MYFIMDLCCICLKYEKHLQRLSLEGCRNTSNFLRIMKTLVPELTYEKLYKHGIICPMCRTKLNMSCMFVEQSRKNCQIYVNYLSKLHSISRTSGRLNVYLKDFRRNRKYKGNIKITAHAGHGHSVIEEVISFKSGHEGTDEYDDEMEYDYAGEFSGTSGYSTTYSDIIPVDDASSNINIEETIYVKSESEETTEEDEDITGEIETITVSPIIPTIQMDEPENEPDETNENIHKCDICGKSFSLLHHFLLTHKHPQSPEKPLMCNQCDQTYSNYKKPQTPILPYKCEICSKTFAQKYNLAAHQRTHSGEKPFICDQCGKAFALNCNLVAHKRTHSGEKPFACDQCDKAFVTSSKLSSHKRVHTGSRPYSCDECGKTFSQSSILVTHKRTHSGEKPYVCDICDKGFITSSNLSSHRRTHTGEKPYRCDECGKVCTHKSNLVTHKRVHMRQKPFACDLCDRTFSMNTSLVTHKMTHREIIQQ